MRNEQNRFSLFRQPADDFHKLFNFLWDQNSRRFVKNQDIIVPIEHFQNFHTLLHSNCDRFHLYGQINGKTVLPD